jgi:predicted KAP-like P-loop ATPase
MSRRSVLYPGIPNKASTDNQEFWETSRRGRRIRINDDVTLVQTGLYDNTQEAKRQIRSVLEQLFDRTERFVC